MLLMWGMRVVVAVLFSVAAATAAEAKRPVLGRTVGEFAAKDTLGKDWSSADLASSKVMVIAVLGTECPLAQLYAPRLQTLADEYESKGVAFIGVAPNRQDSITELSAYVRRQGLKFPLLKDLNNVIADQLGAERTPEVFVLDAQRVVRYHGRIDDQYAVGGRNKPTPTQQELKAAIDDVLADRAVAVPSTPAMGCLIGRVRTPTVDAAVTYTTHIAKILNDRCVECHRPGEIAPFSLTEYDEVAGWADMIAEVTQERRMPPWHADPKFGHFMNENRLTDDELATIQAWVKAGAPQGDPAAKPPQPTFTTGWQLPREPDLVVAMRDKPFAVKSTGEVRYQYFMADPGLTEDKWIAGAEVIPGNRAVVHHVIVFAAKDGKVLDEDRQFLCAYVPGLRVKPYRSNMAKRVPAGAKLIFQLHYTPIGTPQEDLTKVGLIFANDSDVKYEVQTVSTRSRSFTIEPYKADQKFSSPALSTPVDVLMLSLSPHMHLRGQSFRYEMTWPSGKTETLLDVPHYDFNWQTAYMLSEPMIIPAGSKLKAFASFDNSTKNLANPDPSATVKWGDQSWEEMLIGYCDIAIERGLVAGKKVQVNSARDEIARTIAGPMFKRLDKNSDGKIERSEVEGRLLDSFNKIDGDKNGIVTLEELETGLPQLRRN
ncbi:MAG: redoxin domain-containing protein [Planctomycetaceae bacterium]|nr:redoxin domain-containing protein [Planctomycetaceae bacterium]